MVTLSTENSLGIKYPSRLQIRTKTPRQLSVGLSIVETSVVHCQFSSFVFLKFMQIRCVMYVEYRRLQCCIDLCLYFNWDI